MSAAGGDWSVLALTANEGLILAAVIGGIVTVVGTVGGTWLLSLLQERNRFRHAMALVIQEVWDNSTQVADFQSANIAIQDLQQRLTTRDFQAARYELASLRYRNGPLWGRLMDKYRGIEKTIAVGQTPPSAEELIQLGIDLSAYWYVPFRNQLRHGWMLHKGDVSLGKAARKLREARETERKQGV